MVTSRLVSNIYYGSKEHLQVCLERLVVEGSIAWWVFCEHKGERIYNPLNDCWEGDRAKRHIHVGIKPNKRLNLDVVYGECLEMIEGKITGFTRNWEFVRSSMDFWMYLFHDSSYLAEKRMIREYNYSINDLVCSDNDIKSYEIKRAKEEFWLQHGIKKEAISVARGQMSEAVFFAHNLRNAYGADKLLKATRKELDYEKYTKNDKNGGSAFRQIGM